MGFSDVDAENKPLSFQTAFEAKRNNHMQELQQKEEEMRQMFLVRVREKEAELKEAEKEVSSKGGKSERTTLCSFVLNSYKFGSFISVAHKVRQTQERSYGREKESGGLAEEVGRRNDRV